jgi:hypothetical protein
LGAKRSLSCREQWLAQRVKHAVHALAWSTCLKQIGRSKDIGLLQLITLL